MEQILTLDKVVSGKSKPVKLGFVVTSIGTEDEPDYDCYLYSVEIPGMSEPDLTENLELRTNNKKFTGDVTWKIRYPVEGTKEDDDDKEITTYKIPEVMLKTSEDAAPSAKATITFPYEAIVTTANWKD